MYPDGTGIGVGDAQLPTSGTGIGPGVSPPAEPFEYAYHPSTLDLSHARYPSYLIEDFYDSVHCCTSEELER
jgi:hypothetical protein